MIGVTDRAKKELKKILTDKADNPQAVLRLIAREQGELGLGIDIQTPEDQVMEHEGSKVLVVADNLAKSLKGVTIDVEDTPQGRQLVIVKNKKS